MKKLALIISAFIFTTSVYAATSTPSAQQKLDTLKDRLASAATQLRQSQKRAVFGTVKVTSVSTITVSTKTNDIKIELTDNIAVFQMIKGKRTTLTTDQVTRGDEVVIFGDYDTNLDILKAQVIFIQDSIPERIFGTITAASKNDYTITIATQEGQSYIVDFETITKAFAWDPTNGIQKTSFAKLVVGDTIHVLETPEPKIANRVSAIRILDIGNLAGITPTASPTAAPTAKPTTKPTPTPTP
ncbi:MAG: hypothetical protein NTY06_04025 [Candidatus Gottesmanbacteria bacterium]|nr:hypothetical protein [Candidatus Gottesmanbacteria bacterium]